MTLVSVVTPSMDSCTTRVDSAGFALFRDCQLFFGGKRVDASACAVIAVECAGLATISSCSY